MARNSPISAGITRDRGLIPESGRSPGGGNGNPLPVFLSGKLYGQKSLGVWGRKESEMTEHAYIRIVNYSHHAVHCILMTFVLQQEVCTF